jgi:hypothetical protein
MLDVRALRPPPHRARAIAVAAALAVAGAAFALGCGGDDSGGGRKLSQARASSLLATLDQIEQDVSAGERTATLRDQVGSLERVSRELRSALEGSAARLQSLVERKCEPAPAPAPVVEPQGATGATGETGPGNGKKKGQKKEKKQKDQIPPDEQLPPGQQGGGGTTGSSGEPNTGGANQP